MVGISTATRYSTGFVSAVPKMKRAVELLTAYARDASDLPQWRTLGTMLSQGLWDNKSNKAWHEYVHEIALRTGDFSALLEVLVSSCIQASSRGELAEARIHLMELEQIARVHGSFDPERLLGIAGCELSAWEGDEPAARSAATMMYAVGQALDSQLQQSLANPL